MKILCFAGSLRVKSFNKQYIRQAHKILQTSDKVESELIDLLDYPMPVFNQDIQDHEFPEAVKQLAAKVEGVQALVISSPEYNGSISSPLKNAIDWLSRMPSNVLSKKQVLLLGASPGAFGAVRGLWHSRRPFEVLGAFVYPEMGPLPKANEAFDAQGEFKEKASHDRLAKLISAFVENL